MPQAILAERGKFQSLKSLSYINMAII